jgi:hypothetical protein
MLYDAHPLLAPYMEENLNPQVKIREINVKSLPDSPAWGTFSDWVG